MNDKDKRQVIDFDEVLDDLPSDDEWVTEREGHGSLSNINLLQAIDARWELQLHRPLHAFAFWLNPHYHYNTDYRQ